MARRKTLHHPEEVRRKIQASQLVNRLNSHALGVLKKPMDATQVRAAEVLLKKSLPDLSAVEFTGKFSGEVDHDHQHSGAVEVIDITKIPKEQLEARLRDEIKAPRAIESKPRRKGD